MTPSAHCDSVDSKIEEPSSWNLPNLITGLRLLLSFVVLILIDLGNAWILTTVIFVLAVSTDYLDGYLARKWNQITPLGRIMDPFVDKVIIGGTMIFLTRLPESGITPWVTFIVIGREMLITGLRSVLEGHGIDFSAKFTGKLKMLSQSVTLPICLMSLSQPFQDWLGADFSQFIFVRDVFVWGTVVITIYSGAEYCYRGWRLLAVRQRPE